jgi:hypothetical protein
MTMPSSGVFMLTRIPLCCRHSIFYVVGTGVISCNVILRGWKGGAVGWLGGTWTNAAWPTRWFHIFCTEFVSCPVLIIHEET